MRTERNRIQNNRSPLPGDSVHINFPEMESLTEESIQIAGPLDLFKSISPREIRRLLENRFKSLVY